MNATHIDSVGPDLFVPAFSPAPQDTPELRDLKKHHPELYAAYVKNVEAGYANNGRMFDNVLRAFLISHYSTVVMYWALFLIGVVAVVAAIVVGMRGEAGAAVAAFVGLGAAAFVAYFIGRSSQSVEENLFYIAWLGMIYNSYWTHLSWATRPETAQAELDSATTAAVTQIQQLLDRHARSVGKRFKLPA
jgi:hypothetical protein